MHRGGASHEESGARDRGGDNGGIYSADPTTGAQTLIDSPLNLNTQVHALDSKNIYYATVGGSEWALYAHAC